MKSKNKTPVSHLPPDQMSHPFRDVKIFSVSWTFHFTMSFPKGKSLVEIIWELSLHMKAIFSCLL